MTGALPAIPGSKQSGGVRHAGMHLSSIFKTNPITALWSTILRKPPSMAAIRYVGLRGTLAIWPSRAAHILRQPAVCEPTPFIQAGSQRVPHPRIAGSPQLQWPRPAAAQSGRRTAGRRRHELFCRGDASAAASGTRLCTGTLRQLCHHACLPAHDILTFKTPFPGNERLCHHAYLAGPQGPPLHD